MNVIKFSIKYGFKYLPVPTWWVNISVSLFIHSKIYCEPNTNKYRRISENNLFINFRLYYSNEDIYNHSRLQNTKHMFFFFLSSRVGRQKNNIFSFHLTALHCTRLLILTINSIQPLRGIKKKKTAPKSTGINLSSR